MAKQSVSSTTKKTTTTKRTIYGGTSKSGKKVCHTCGRPL